MSGPVVPGGLGDEVVGGGVFRAVLEGYEAVYDALPRGATFNRLWRMYAYSGDFPEQFAHIGFLTAGEGQRLRELLVIRPGEVLADLACGAGGRGCGWPGSRGLRWLVSIRRRRGWRLPVGGLPMLAWPGGPGSSRAPLGTNLGTRRPVR